MHDHRWPARANAARLAADLWDLDGWVRLARGLLRALDAAGGDLAGQFTVAAAIVRHLLADPLLPGELLPDGWPGRELRRAYGEFEAYWAPFSALTHTHNSR